MKDTHSDGSIHPSVDGSGAFENEGLVKGSGGKKSSSSRDDKDMRLLRRILSTKGLVFLTLLIAGTGLALAVNLLISEEEEEVFSTHFKDISKQVVHSVQLNTKNLFGILHGLATTTTSSALSQNGAWPNCTIPDFEQRADDARILSKTSFLAFSPLVSGPKRQAWESYANKNQAWVKKGLAFEGSDETANMIPIFIHQTIHQNPFTFDPLPADAEGPFSPVWQIADVAGNQNLVNFDLFQNDDFRHLEDIVDRHAQPTLSRALDIASLLGSAAPETDGRPHSVLLQPVQADFSEPSPTTGHLLAVIALDALLEGILQEGIKAHIICVIRNTCGQEFTYELHGPKVVYVGEGNRHESRFNKMAVEAKLVDYAEMQDIGNFVEFEDECNYELLIYPTSSLEDTYESSLPLLATLGVVFVFVLTGIVFLVYDFFVSRRQHSLEDNALRSNKMIDSLFPQNVRDQLLQAESTPSSPSRESKKLELMPKAGLKTFLQDADESKIQTFDSNPIADLFPDCTVMFADIAGFTAWSSIREPSHVFTLLETIYHTFDQMAKKQRVFKVETVGDCYVAVTGLPEPRKDHAIVMARFALDCIDCFNELVKRLELTLGPDTGDLALRVGLHSGPVTAGVLRGDRARFQLFGDTVNTASRIESSGQRNRIHISQDTADLIKQAGKGGWLVPREDIVVAKGKGALQTFWLSKGSSSPEDGTENQGEGGGAVAPAGDASAKLQTTHEEDTKKAVSMKMQRLIDWNCDLLLKLLKKVIARRNSTQQRSPLPSEVARIEAMETKLGEGQTVLEEVVEMIPMPRFDAGASSDANDEDSKISAEVTKQLRTYVSVLASMYRDNPFHSFEHASHVMMSTSKLLSRIVAPDAVGGGENGGDLASALHDHTFGITSDPLTQFSVVLSALIHDVDHRGVPNFVLIKEDPYLGAVYKNKSVAEQNSVDLAWNALMDPGFTELRRCIYGSEMELRRFRQLIVNSVMATDIFDKELAALRKDRWEKAFQEEAVTSKEEKDANDDRKATIVIEHLIQASDVSHTMQHWHVYRKWNERLFEEMYMAYRTKRTDKDPSEGWYKGEMWFFDNYIIPLTQKLKECGVFGVSSDEYLNYAINNRREWEKKGQQTIDQLVAKFKEQEEEEQEEELVAVQIDGNRILD